jgi:hypothetical protein
MKKIIILFLFLLSIPIITAHIPELVTEDRNYTLEPINVKGPEISYAYYGKLYGSPQIYKIDSEKPFHLYVSLLVPYVGQEETSDVEFHIIKDGEKIVMMHDYQNWTKWYEEYGGDWYLQGPEYEADVGAGIYLIEVHSDTNSEDYTLAIGKIERFGAVEILKTILVLPVMKSLFWNSYLMMGLYIIIVVVGIVFVIYIIMRRRRKRSKKREEI